MQKGVVRKRRVSKPSEYGTQLRAKQDLRTEYGLRERQFKNYIKEILGTKQKDDASQLLLRDLETRLDNVVFRMGVARTRREGRQIVSHGHIFVNGIRMKIPSYAVKKGNVVSVGSLDLKKTIFKNAQLAMSKYQPPLWIELNKEKMEAKILELPSVQHLEVNVDLPLVFEFYSR